MNNTSFFLVFVLFVCSVSANSNYTRRQKIVGGRPAEHGEYPSIAAIFKNYQHICGCTVIDHYHLLTAAHCFTKPKQPEIYTVVAGAHNIDYYFDEEHAKEYTIDQIFIHPKYKSVEDGYDIAVIRTIKPIEMNAYVKEADLPPPGFTCGAATVWGWGATSDGGSSSDVLRKVTVPVITNELCGHKYGIEHIPIYDSQICCGYERGGKDSCTGDSGGPLLCSYPQYQIGIVSYGIGCAEGRYPGVYTRVTSYLQWIRNIQDSGYGYGY